MKTSEIQKDIVNISKDHMKKKMKAIHIGDLLDGLLKKYGIKRFEDEGSDFKDRFSDIIDSMKKSEIIKEVPIGYIVVIPGGEKLIKESRTFSEHLKFLVEGKLNEATNDFSDTAFDELKKMNFKFNGSKGVFSKDVFADSKISKILVIAPTDDEDEVELKIYNYKLDEDNLYLEGYTIPTSKLSNISKIVTS